MLTHTLTPETLAQGVAFLSKTDQDLARIHAVLGLPPIWARDPGFPTLVRIILEQQVSLASAGAAFDKLLQALPIITPQAFLELDDAELKRIGFSRQKTAYCRGLALAVLHNDIDLDQLSMLDDETVRTALIKLKGVGPWTADIYLLMVLLRPDVWPAGDLALITAYQKLKGLPSRPTSDELAQTASAWRPWRAVAARLLWHYYLSGFNL